MVSETVDIPERSYSSEDLCSLEVQGSLCSADLSSCSTAPKGPTDQSCSTHCRFHRTHSEGFPDEDDSSHSQASTDRSQGLEKNCAYGRSLDCSSENFSLSELQNSAQGSNATPPLKQKQICCADVSQPPVPSQTSPCFGPTNTSSYISGNESVVQQHHVTNCRSSSIVRSTSDPVSCSSCAEGRYSTSRLVEHETNEWCVIYVAIGAPGNYTKCSSEGWLMCDGFSSMRLLKIFCYCYVEKVN